jgi:hypothetical protein
MNPEKGRAAKVSYLRFIESHHGIHIAVTTADWARE